MTPGSFADRPALAVADSADPVDEPLVAPQLWRADRLIWLAHPLGGSHGDEANDVIEQWSVMFGDGDHVAAVVADARCGKAINVVPGPTRLDGLADMVTVAAQTTELGFGRDTHDGVVGLALELAGGSR